MSFGNFELSIDLSFLDIIWVKPALYAVVLFIITVVFFYLKRKMKHTELHGLDRVEIKKRWDEIEGLMTKRDELSHKLAVMEADKLLDHVLKAMWFPGSTLGDRLKYACDKHKRLCDVWWAHKVRNQLVHEANFHLDYRTAKKVIYVFGKSLETLGIL